MLTVKPPSRQKADRSSLGQGDNPTLSTLRACPRSAPEAPSMVRPPAGSGGHGHEAPRLTRESERPWSGPEITSSDSRSGVHDQAAAVFSNFGATPEITSHHVTALWRLDLRQKTRTGITSHHVTALWRLDLRPATPPGPGRDGSSRRALPCARGASRTRF
jgi:hypothetical protein